MILRKSHIYRTALLFVEKKKKNPLRTWAPRVQTEGAVGGYVTVISTSKGQAGAWGRGAGGDQRRGAEGREATRGLEGALAGSEKVLRLNCGVNIKQNTASGPDPLHQCPGQTLALPTARAHSCPASQALQL